jgi:hypothetical protein
MKFHPLSYGTLTFILTLILKKLFWFFKTFAALKKVLKNPCNFF